MLIGESLQRAWQIFKQHAGAFVACSFALVLVQGVLDAVLRRAWDWPLPLVFNLLLLGLTLGGQVNVARLASRGQEPTLRDAFAPFTARQGDYLLVGLAYGAGTLVCGVGFVVTSYLFLLAPVLLVDGHGFKHALGRSKDLMLENLGDVVGLFIVVMALNVLGALTVVGWLVALPITSLMVVDVYDQLSARQLQAGDIA